MRILGIDPGYAIVGYGVIDYIGNNFKIVEYGAITTGADEEMNSRFKTIHDDLNDRHKRGSGTGRAFAVRAQPRREDL